MRVATLAIFANVLGLIMFLQSRSHRLLGAVVDPLHPDWLGMERAFAGFTIYAASLLGVAAVLLLFATRFVWRRLREGRAPRRPHAATVVLALGLTGAVVLVFIEVLIFQDYGIHFYEFDVLGILANAALRRDLGIQPAEVARVTGAAAGLLVVELGLCFAAVRAARWRDGALARACGAAMCVAVPGGLAVFHAGEGGIGALRSEFEGALPLGRQLLMRTDARPYIPVRARVGPDGYRVLAPSDSAPALARTPDILFYVPDGLRADMVREELTPNLLRLAAGPHAITSARHFSTGHVSEAGIFGLLYGVNAHAFNAFIGERVPAFPLDVLRRHGYRLVFISSSRLNPYPTDQLIRQFDEVVFPENDDAAIEALRGYASRRASTTQPLFVLAFMYTPHYPFTSAKPHLRRYPMVGPKARSNYMNDVIQADDYLRQALALFRSDSTIVLVTSDHGEEIRDHGVFGHASATFWNEKVQVPFVLRLPGVSGSTPDAALSSHVDVWPTIFDHLGAPVPPEQYSDGQSLLRPPPASGRAAVVNGRFFPFADRPSLVVGRTGKYWFRATGLETSNRLCLEVTRVTDLEDAPSHAPADRAALDAMQASFFRFLQPTAPVARDCPTR